MPETRAARTRYDWKLWSDGACWILRPGEDFPDELTLDELHDRAYVYAYRHGMFAHLERHDGGDACTNRACVAGHVTHPEETGRFLYVWFEARQQPGSP